MCSFKSHESKFEEGTTAEESELERASYRCSFELFYKLVERKCRNLRVFIYA